MSIQELLQQRQSIRAFVDREVPKSEVEAVLSDAGLSASGGNVQPWKVYALAGQARQELVDAVFSKLAQGLRRDNSEVETYPKKLKEPYRDRRFECGMTLYEALDIDREDKPTRIKQWNANQTFFGAPVGLIFTMDQQMGKAQYLDLGIYFQAVMLCAQERGLSTCAQRSWAAWANTVRESLGLPEDEQVVTGMAMGYADMDQPVNQFRTSRVDLDEIASFRGF